MKKQLSAGATAAVLTGCFGLAHAAPTPATNAMYAGLTPAGAVAQKLVIKVSGACTGAVELNSFVMAGLWKVDQVSGQPDPKNQIAGAVGLFPYSDIDDEEKMFAVMAGSFGPKYNYSLSNNAKGETFKVSAPAYIDSQSLYEILEAAGPVIPPKTNRP